MPMRKIQPESASDMGMEISSPKIKYFPTLYLDNEVLPEGKGWAVGKTYEIKLQIRMTGFSMRKGRDTKEHGNSDFEIVGIEPGKEIKTKTTRYV